jgi:uncharacterized protein
MKKWRVMLGIVLAAMAGLSRAEARDIPSLRTYVTDEAGILKPDERALLEAKLSSLKARTTAQVFILTVKSLQGETLFTFSQRTFEKWKPGMKRKDNGVLLVYAVAEQGRRIHVGRGLEGDIPDAEAIRIIRQIMDPHLAKKDYYNAFLAGTSRIDRIISGTERVPEVVETKHEEQRMNAKYLLFLLAFVALALAHFYHPVVGGIIGASAFAGAAWLIALTDPAIIAAAIIGGVLGLILRWITDIPWCGGGCGDMGSAVAGAGGDALGAGAELLGGL